MRNIYVRGKDNIKIDVELKRELEQVHISLENKFNKYVKYEDRIFRDKFLDIEFIFPFEKEDDKKLEEILKAISIFDKKSILEICDESKHRFVMAFDYIDEKLIVTKENYEKFYDVFLYLFNEAKTINSISLAVFMLYKFSPKCLEDVFKVLSGDVQFLEIISYFKREDINASSYYERVFKCFYKEEKYFDVFLYVNNNCSKNIRVLMCIFYLFDVLKKDYSQFQFKEVKQIIEYIQNYFGLLRNINVDFIFYNDEKKHSKILFKILEDMNEVLRNIQSLLKENICECIDLDILIFNLEFYNDFRESFKDHDFIIKGLEECINNKNLKEGKKILRICSIIEYDLVCLFEKHIQKYYDDEYFLEFVIRLTREQSYYYKIINIIEQKCYLTKILNNSNFRNLILRTMVSLYRNISVDTVGINILKICMNSFKTYDESKNYINYLFIKVLERSE